MTSWITSYLLRGFDMAYRQVDVIDLSTYRVISVKRSWWARVMGDRYATQEEVERNLRTEQKVSIAKSQRVLSDEPYFSRGMRVLINENSGFSKGARGVVVFVEPAGKIWVHRDGSSSPCFFMPYELTLDDSESPAHPVPLKNLISDNCRFLFSKFMAGKFEEGFETVVYRILDWASVQDLYKGNNHVQKAEGLVAETPGS